MLDRNLVKLPPTESSGFINSYPSTKAVPPYNGRFRLEESMSYDVGFPMSGDRITVPKGFITDFASVPRILHSVFPPRGKHSGAAIIHDYLYATQKRSRSESDSIFLEAMKVLGVGWFRRSTMYSAVRVGGWLPWKRAKKKLNN